MAVALDPASQLSATNEGALHALVTPYQGYLVTLPRLVALGAVHLNLVRAALLFNFVGLLVQIAPCVYLISARCHAMVPSTAVRWLLAGLYILIPSFELNITLTNALWHLGILAVLVIAADPPPRWPGRLSEAVVIVTVGLTGVFSFCLLPLGALRWAQSRSRWHLVITGVLTLTAAACQALVLFHAQRPSTNNLGASGQNAAYLIADRVTLQALFGQEGHQDVFTFGQPNGNLLAIAIALPTLLLLGAAIARGPFVLTGMICLGTFCAVGGMLRPAVGADVISIPIWVTTIASTNAERYLFALQLALLGSLVWAATCLPLRLRRAACIVLTTTFMTGVILHPQYQAYVDLNPAAYQHQLNRAKAGERVEVPLNPPGWSMVLVKR